MTAAHESLALRVDGGLERALDQTTLARLESAQLLHFLGGRRWFGAKGRVFRSARVAGVAPLGAAMGSAAITRIEVEVDNGEPLHYQLPLIVRSRSGDGAPSPSTPVLARVESGSESGLLIDAVDDQAFRLALARAFARGGSFGSGDLRWVIEPLANSDTLALDRVTSTRVGSAEQSNSSIIIGEEAILKLFRRLEPGENPDVEISRFLSAHTGFRGTPALLGTIRLEQGSGTATAGMLQRFLKASTDAWSHALSTLRPYLASPANREIPIPFAEEAREIGRVTRELHEALASGATGSEFAAERATASDIGQWAAATRASIASAFEVLRRRTAGEGGASALDQHATEVARALLQRRAAIDARVDEIESTLAKKGGDDAGSRIRHHGDYHLGQLLRTSDGRFIVIDFEGEPARPLEERRRKASPLRDVAGMLRSFAYAAASAAMEVGGVGTNAVLETRAARWERDVRQRFLDAYLAAAPHPAGNGAVPQLLPRGGDHTLHLLTLFEIDKMFYELSYELDNRPSWAWIPMRGIARLL